MACTVSLSELTNMAFCCELVECHRQIWRNGIAWNGYADTPRFADGLMLVCSQIRVTFRDATGRTVTASRGDLVYAPEGSRYAVEFSNGGSDPDLYTVNFRLRDTDGNRICLGEDLQKLATDTTSECRCLAGELALACLDPNRNRLYRFARLLDFLSAVSENTATRNAGYYPILRGMRRLAAEWDRNARMEDYAALCGISCASFYQHFKEWTGMSPNAYRTCMRIRASKSLLRNSTLSVQEIAAQVGFHDPYYFSRCFRRAVGVSPQQYRKSENPVESEMRGRICIDKKR